MAKYRVLVNITASQEVEIEVEAPSEKQALDRAIHDARYKYSSFDFEVDNTEIIECERLNEEGEPVPEPIEFQLHKQKAPALPGFEKLVYGGS